MTSLKKLFSIPYFEQLFFRRRQLETMLRAEQMAHADSEAALALRIDLMRALARELRAPLTPIIAELALLELEPQATECLPSIRAIRKHVEEQADAIGRILDEHNVPDCDDEFETAHAGTFRPRILLVEDHELTRYAVKQLLWRYGFKVTSVATKAEALDAAKGTDFMLCDIGLPDGSGLDVMREAAKSGVRGVAISGFGSDADRQASLDAGFCEHLSKPLDIRRLLRAIATFSSPDVPAPAKETPVARRTRVA